jgi:hypothetical protein
MKPYENPDPPEDDQDAYERIRSWIARDGATKAYDETVGQCLYQAGDGNRCAIGGILPEDLLRLVDQDESGISGVLQDYPGINEWFVNCDGQLLSDFQKAHDEADNHPERWQADALARLDAIAQAAGLRVVKT